MSKEEIPEEISFVKPFLPPLREIMPYLDRIWESRQLTNGGTIHSEFEKALCASLGVRNVSLFANGTLALIIALKSFRLKGEVITTPFTSPATLQAIYWNNLKPVFADIRETDLTLNPGAIEEAITPDTVAILPVHIFGMPCDVESIQALAASHGLKVVYDAAHCFGVEINGSSIGNFGDLSVLSFHATKVFNTFEGGAIVCNDPLIKTHIDALKNTGIDSEHNLIDYGINAKMNELQAAFGLCQLPYIEKFISARKEAAFKYRMLLKGTGGIILPPETQGIRYNYSYFPILVDPTEFGTNRDELHDYLGKRNIVTQKYFYPLVSDSPLFSKYKTGDLPVAQKTAKNILCIPLFPEITDLQIGAVVDSILQLHSKY